MAVHRFSIIQHWVFILVLVSSLCMTATSLTLEQRVEKLEKDYSYFKREFEAKIKTLETNVTVLQTKVSEQESLLRALKIEQVADVQLVSQNVDRSQQQVAIHRTCHEALAANASIASGMYLNDPDGQGIGDDPIYVVCDMKTGLTSVRHDTEKYMEVGNCDGPGCYSRNVTYSATMRQMKALAELSSECHQSIRYDCVDAPLQLHNVNFSWWNDRNGKPKYFWSGNNDRTHICQCGIDRNCYESSKGVSCNCDSVLKRQLSDSGIITKKEILPITRLNFGRTLLKSSSGFHTLGLYECSGQMPVFGVPKSCSDLWHIGHTFSGLYSIMGRTQVESVYCDFTKLPKDPGFQTWIGYNDVKSQPVYFYVQKSNLFNKPKTPIPFEVAQLNIGNAMNLASGKFTAPRHGTYFFAFTGFARFPGSPSRLIICVDIYLNGNRIGRGHADEVDRAWQYGTFSFQSILNLKTGDQIWLEVDCASPGTYLDDSIVHHNHFSGWLLEENISLSLSIT